MKRTRKQVIWDFVQSWLRKAEGDLRAAERLLEVPQEDYFAAAFHAQQAAEKFLKALLVRLQIPFPKTHDIEQLLQLATPSDPSLEEELTSATILTPYGIEFRYPGEEIADLETAQQAVDEAKQVKTVVLGRLQDYLNPGRLPDPDP
ncbi:MAG TPA: HEPN domain-containing protein [Candidatus Binatia bacterium]|jgi:HEPN domain-containing protein|nr:HEPN domain-containing protein [Candidatus Binatia bacterium]